MKISVLMLVRLGKLDTYKCVCVCVYVKYGTKILQKGKLTRSNNARYVMSHFHKLSGTTHTNTYNNVVIKGFLLQKYIFIYNTTILCFTRPNHTVKSIFFYDFYMIFTCKLIINTYWLTVYWKENWGQTLCMYVKHKFK